MEYRLGTLGDLDEIFEMVQAAKKLMSSQGIKQWDEVYPAREDFEGDIKKSTLYVAVLDGRIAAVYVVSEECDAEYGKCSWQNEKPCILHRLCVSSLMQNRGIGREVLLHAENQLKEMGYDSVRLDVFSQNPYALRLYEKNGYERRGSALWRKGLFFLMEKKLV